MRVDLKIATLRNHYRLVVGELIPSIESGFEYPLAVSAFFCAIQGLTLSPRRAYIYAAIETAECVYLCSRTPLPQTRVASDAVSIRR